MTIQEAIESMLTEYELETNTILKTCLDRGISSTKIYALEDKKKTELCVADICIQLATNPNYVVGTKNISPDRGALLTQAQKLYKEHGVKSISGVSIW